MLFIFQLLIRFHKLSRICNSILRYHIFAADSKQIMNETSIKDLVEDMSRLAMSGRKTNQDDPQTMLSLSEKEKNRTPYRARASTDGFLDQRRLRKLRMNICLRTNFLKQRRMSIAMQGDSAGF